MKKYVSVFLKLLLAAYVFSVGLLLLLAFLLYKFHLSEEIVTAAVVAIYIISTFMSGFLAGKRIGHQKYLWGLLIGAAYFIVLVIVSFCMKQSLGQMGQSTLMTMFLCLASGMLGGMVS